MLKVGDKVPPFSLTSDAGKQVSLASLGAGPLVVYFYPKDDTSGCTREAQGFAGASKQFTKLGAQIVGVSKDSVESHCRFRDKYKLNFPLLSDPDLAVHKAFGAWGEKNMYGKKVQGTIRSTFVIQSGKVAHVFSNVKVDGHVESVLARIAAPNATAATSTPPAKRATKKPSKKAAPKRAPTRVPAPPKSAKRLKAKTSQRTRSSKSKAPKAK